MDTTKVKEICSEIIKRFEEKHIGVFSGLTKDVFLISDEYPGVWLEHVYDSVFYATLFPEKGKQIAKNTLEMFMEYQKENGQLPCYVRDNERWRGGGDRVGYSQVQECVSFGSLCVKVYELTGDIQLLEKCFGSVKKWVAWYEENRMTTHRSLPEMFVGFDTGHDNSARLEGLSCKGNYRNKDERVDASVLPPNDKVAPVLAVDMACNYYGNIRSLCEMAHILKDCEAEKAYSEKALAVKDAIFEKLFDKDDCFFYDVDKDGNMRKNKSCTIFHLFMEKVLDEEKDKALIDEIYTRHINNPDEFRTPYPYPSMAANDPSFGKVTPQNCWGYFSQGLLALRATLWLDYYGWKSDMDELCRKWLDAWTACYGKVNLGQELDPFTGEPSQCSQWYSSCMLFYVYSAKRLGIN